MSTKTEDKQKQTTLARLLNKNNILDDVISGLSQQEIALKYCLSIEEVRQTVNDVFVQTTDRYADLRQRIGMLSILRYEKLLTTIMPYVEGVEHTRELTDGSIETEHLPPDPRFVKLALDIIKAENDLFERERQILMKTQDNETGTGMQNVEETMVFGDDLYTSASDMMSMEGVEGLSFADMDADDVLAHSEQVTPTSNQENLQKRADDILKEDPLMEEARRRGLIKDD